MPSSKIFRRGRWIWGCTWENRSISWEDHDACDARSRLSYTTEEEAKIASYSHRCRKGSGKVTVWQIK